ncbi:thymidylate synthase [Gordonia phage Agatha]|uniref:Thymidylate synthase n=1 Tax=Gordonia phage Agatha TaxID=2584490 RepID=A0A4Y5NZ98_9CAUD|nr:thymidylate synthase [Gordonia phage Agatha]
MIRVDKLNYPRTRDVLARELVRTTPVNRGSWQSGDAPSSVHELEDVLLQFNVPAVASVWAADVYPGAQAPGMSPDLDWAEAHFQERISGQPLNPAPSYLNWPWHSDKYKEEYKAKHLAFDNDPNFGRVAVELREQPFDHTYPERMWPTFAGSHHLRPDCTIVNPMHGIRFDYGDLSDVIALLRRDPFTRQAYLPIWFPEDTGSTAGQRVPCTLGYHFIRYGAQLNVKYFIRSCDITRHLHNDVYMAGRLLQYVVSCLEGARSSQPGFPFVGDLTMFISNLHMFTADEWRYTK